MADKPDIIKALKAGAITLVGLGIAPAASKLPFIGSAISSGAEKALTALGAYAIPAAAGFTAYTITRADEVDLPHKAAAVGFSGLGGYFLGADIAAGKVLPGLQKSYEALNGAMNSGIGTGLLEIVKGPGALGALIGAAGMLAYTYLDSSHTEKFDAARDGIKYGVLTGIGMLAVPTITNFLGVTLPPEYQMYANQIGEAAFAGGATVAAVKAHKDSNQTLADYVADSAIGAVAGAAVGAYIATSPSLGGVSDAYNSMNADANNSLSGKGLSAVIQGAGAAGTFLGAMGSVAYNFFKGKKKGNTSE